MHAGTEADMRRGRPAVGLCCRRQTLAAWAKSVWFSARLALHDRAACCTVKHLLSPSTSCNVVCRPYMLCHTILHLSSEVTHVPEAELDRNAGGSSQPTGT